MFPLFPHHLLRAKRTAVQRIAAMAKGAKGHSFKHKKVTAASGKLDADNDGMLGDFFTSKSNRCY